MKNRKRNCKRCRRDCSDRRGVCNDCRVTLAAFKEAENQQSAAMKNRGYRRVPQLLPFPTQFYAGGLS